MFFSRLYTCFKISDACNTFLVIVTGTFSTVFFKIDIPRVLGFYLSRIRFSILYVSIKSLVHIKSVTLGIIWKVQGYSKKFKDEVPSFILDLLNCNEDFSRIK